jgi:ComF family protein
MGAGLCSGCRDSAPDFDRALSFGEYEGELRGLIHLLKYDRATPVASPLGNMLAHAITELVGDNATPVVVPVPLHRRRRRSRGFNQSELIARAAVRQLPRKLEILNGALLRQRDTISQVGLSREERIENVRDAFRVAQPSRVQGRDILLVDDVMTTGTTLSECARVLKQAGAKRVWAATVARAFDSASQLTADPGEEEAIEVGEPISF